MSTERGESEMRAFRVVGRVQGVGFRWWTRRVAEGLGLTGRVRNLPDGSVEVHAAGEERDLVRLAEALREGPPMSRVDRLETIEADPGTPRTDFRLDL